MDNAGGHPSHLDDFHNDIKVIFMTPNTITSLTQPMDQGAISAFIAHYLTTFAHDIEAIDSNVDLFD